MNGLELPPYRPPSEAHSLLLRVTRNCPWNRCTYCGMYKGEKFQLRPVEEIKRDIIAYYELAEEVRGWAEKAGYPQGVGVMAAYYGLPWLAEGSVKNVFIGDSNSLIMKTEELVEVLETIRQVFPLVERVTMYARAKTALKKPLEDLKRLKEAGLSRLHLGLETGDDELLLRIQKGATSEEMIAAGLKIKDAGISLSEYIILGMGGKDRREQHIAGTARVLNAIDPDFIRVRTLRISADTPLYQEWRRGEFHPQTPWEVISEERELVASLEATSHYITNDFSINFPQVEGKLPGEKERLLKAFDDCLASEEIKKRLHRQPPVGVLMPF